MSSSSDLPDARQALDAATPILNLDARDYDRGWRDGYQHARTGQTSGADYPRLASDSSNALKAPTEEVRRRERLEQICDSLDREQRRLAQCVADHWQGFNQRIKELESRIDIRAEIGANGPESPVTAHRIVEIEQRLERIDHNIAALTTKQVKHGESLDRTYKRIDELEAEAALAEDGETEAGKRIDAVGIRIGELEVNLNRRINAMSDRIGEIDTALHERITGLDRMRGTLLESLGKSILDLEQNILIDQRRIDAIAHILEKKLDRPDVPKTDELEHPTVRLQRMYGTPPAEEEPINKYADLEPRQLVNLLVNAAQNWQMHVRQPDAGAVHSAETEAYGNEVVRRLEEVWNT